jgi:hypothetical protein
VRTLTEQPAKITKHASGAMAVNSLAVPRSARPEPKPNVPIFSKALRRQVRTFSTIDEVLKPDEDKKLSDYDLLIKRAEIARVADPKNSASHDTAPKVPTLPTRSILPNLVEKRKSEPSKPNRTIARLRKTTPTSPQSPPKPVSPASSSAQSVLSPQPTPITNTTQM